MERALPDTRRPRWAVLALFAAIAFPVNLVLGAAIVRLSLAEGLSTGEFRDAARDVLDFLVEFPRRLIEGRGEDWTVLVTAVVFLASQVVFLVPWAAWRPQLGSGPGWSLRLSAASAGAVGACVAVGLAYGFGEALVQVWITGFPSERGRNQAVEVLESSPFHLDDPTMAVLLLAPLIGLVPLWILCGVLLARLAPDADPMRAEAQLRRLLAGSVASIVLMIPFDALARKRGACICTTGTWIAMCVGFAALVWLAGPAVVLLLSRRRRLAWRREACIACGYSRRGAVGERCPECGSTYPAGASPGSIRT